MREKSLKILTAIWKMVEDGLNGPRSNCIHYGPYSTRASAIFKEISRF